MAQEQRLQEQQQGRWITHEIALHDGQHAVRAPGPCEHCTATWVPRIGGGRCSIFCVSDEVALSASAGGIAYYNTCEFTEE